MDSERIRDPLVTILVNLVTETDVNRKLSLLDEVKSIVTFSPHLDQECLLSISSYMYDQDLNVKLKATEIIAFLACDQYRFKLFYELISSLNPLQFCVKLDVLSCYGMLLKVLRTKNDFFVISALDNTAVQNNLMEILTKHLSENDENLFAENILNKLYAFFNKYYRLLEIPLLIRDHYSKIVSVLNGIILYKILKRQPIYTFNHIKLNLSQDEVKIISKKVNEENVFGKFPIALIKNLIHSNLTFDQETKQNFLLFFFKFFTGNLEHQILEENQIIESIYSKFDKNFKGNFTLDNNELQNYMEEFFHMLIKKWGDIGYYYFQHSAKYLKNNEFMFNYFNRYFLSIEKIYNFEYLSKFTSKKFIKILFENFLIVSLPHVNFTTNLNLLFANLPLNYFDFLEDFIMNSVEDNFSTNNITGILFILEAGRQRGVFKYNKKFCEKLEQIILLPAGNKIINKINEAIKKFPLWQLKVKFIDLEFLLELSKLVDKYPKCEEILGNFIEFSSNILLDYNPNQDVLLNWLITKFKESCSDEILKNLERLLEKLNNKNNPIIKKFLKEQKEKLVPELDVNHYNDYDDYAMDLNDSVSKWLIKNYIEDGEVFEKELPKILTEKEKEEIVKESFKEIIKTSKDNREYYEDIFQNLILEAKKKKKDLVAVLNQLLMKNILKTSSNLNSQAFQYQDISNLIGSLIRKYLDKIVEKNFSISNIILKVQISLTFTFYEVSQSNSCNNFEKLMKILIENCYNSLFIEINRAYNKDTYKGDFNIENAKADSMISTESFENDTSNSVESESEIKIQTDYNEKNCKDKTLEIKRLEDYEITYFYKEIIDCIDNSFSFNGLNETSTFSYSKYSHLFSFSGYTNIKTLTLKEIKNQVASLLDSGILSKEIASQFQEYIIIIIEIEIMMDKRLKNYNFSSIQNVQSKIRNLLNKNNLPYLQLW
jgi:hypothetical protein